MVLGVVGLLASPAGLAASGVQVEIFPPSGLAPSWRSRDSRTFAMALPMLYDGPVLQVFFFLH